jgi:hypothetical protein
MKLIKYWLILDGIIWKIKTLINIGAALLKWGLFYVLVTGVLFTNFVSQLLGQFYPYVFSKKAHYVKKYLLTDR